MKRILTIILIVCTLVAISTGAYSVEWEAFYKLLTGDNTNPQLSYLILHIRLPRVLMAIFVGAALAVSGAAIQGLFRNPLADHGLIGVSGGAMLSASVYIVLGSSWVAATVPFLQPFALSIMAFIGGLLTTILVYKLSSKKGRTSTITMLLAGIAITAMAGALTGLLTYFSTEEQLRDITFWSLGSLSGANWTGLMILIPSVIIGVLWLSYLSQQLNILALGEQEANYLGLSVEHIKYQIMFIAAWLVAISVAFVGMIGFVGLVIPHLIRLFHSSDYRQLIPLSALLGAILLLCADTFARTILAPAELPIGILTALIGSPFFLGLLLKSKQTSILVS